MKHASLFSGIGGFDLAAEWMGWENVFHCEWNDFGKKILNYYWPKAKSYGDITKTDFTLWRGKINILTGGFPCQPFSLSGNRKGTSDDRYLWPEMLRAIREIQPAWVIGENVAGIISMVQPGDELEMGCEASLFDESYFTEEQQRYVIETICSDLEREGYSVQPILVPACAVGAPHRRDRVWFIAHNPNARVENMRQGEIQANSPKSITNTNVSRHDKPNTEIVVDRRDIKTEHLFNGETKPTTNTTSQQGEQLQPEQSCYSEQEQRQFGGIGGKSGNGIVGDTASSRLQGRVWGESNLLTEPTTKGIASNPGRSEWENGLHGEKSARETAKFGDDYTKFGQFESFPTVEPTICGGDDGFPHKLDGITFPKWRNESIKAYGNAIVPQVAYQIFKTLELFTNTK